VAASTDGRDRLRTVMSELVTGICVVSTLVHGRPGEAEDAVVVNSFTSVSLEPPLVSLYLRQDSTFLNRLRRSGVWAASILGSGTAEVAKALSRPYGSRPPLAEVGAWHSGPETGCPVLDGSPATIECELYRCVELGDHVLVIGSVVGLDTTPAPPLVFHRGAYHAPFSDLPR